MLQKMIKTNYKPLKPNRTIVCPNCITGSYPVNLRHSGSEMFVAHRFLYEQRFLKVRNLQTNHVYISIDVLLLILLSISTWRKLF